MAGLAFKRSVWPYPNNGPSKGFDGRKFFIEEMKLLKDVKQHSQFCTFIDLNSTESSVGERMQCKCRVSIEFFIIWFKAL